jgi:hypothetical protein
MLYFLFYYVKNDNAEEFFIFVIKFGFIGSKIFNILVQFRI